MIPALVRLFDGRDSLPPLRAWVHVNVVRAIKTYRHVCVCTMEHVVSWSGDLFVTCVASDQQNAKRGLRSVPDSYKTIRSITRLL